MRAEDILVQDTSEFKTLSLKLFSIYAYDGKSENIFFLSRPKIPLKIEVFSEAKLLYSVLFKLHTYMNETFI